MSYYKKNRRKKQRHPFWILGGLILILSGIFYIRTSEVTFSSPLTAFQHQSQQDYAKQANSHLQTAGIKTPLLLQTDERWRTITYGTGENNDIANNGCALMSLSMVLSYWRNQTVDPNEIFQWAGNRYFVAGQGTAWSIFPDFAKQYQLQYHDLGNDFQAAAGYLAKNIPVIISVTNGDFTDGGHILVLAAFQNNHLKVLDPNDTPDKNHYQLEFSPEQIQKQTIHYWTYTK